MFNSLDAMQEAFQTSHEFSDKHLSTHDKLMQWDDGTFTLSGTSMSQCTHSGTSHVTVYSQWDLPITVHSQWDLHVTV